MTRLLLKRLRENSSKYLLTNVDEYRIRSFKEHYMALALRPHRLGYGMESIADSICSDRR